MSVHVPERRRGYRKQASAMAILRPLNPPGGSQGNPQKHPNGDRPSQTLDAHVFDLSIHGVGLSVREAIEVGTLLYFQMCDGRQSGSRIEVKSCRLRADNMFDVGGQFC